MNANIIMAPVAQVENSKASKASKSATKSSRPVRMSRFEVYEYDIDEKVYNCIASESEPLFKSDVHYCAEKFAIDYIAHMGQNDVANTKLALYKTKKGGGYDDAVCVSVIWWDEDTKQVIID